MDNKLEYIFSLTDLVSGKLQNISVASEKTLDVFAGLQVKNQSINNSFKETGRTLNTLKEKVQFLQAEKDWIPTKNVKGIKAYNAEINKLNKEINKLENIKGGGFKNWVGGLASSVPVLKMVLNPIVLITAASYKLTRTINAGLSAWNLQTEAETKLAAVMRNTMNAGDAEVKTILKLTAAQQKMGVIGDEIQLAGAQELATYLSRRDSLEKIIPVMNDMLAQQYGLNATQEQAANIASMLGKVMDGQTGALSRYGYKFTEVQENILKYGKESQRAAVLAEVVGEAVGGVNKALAETPEGRWKQHKNEMGDLSERFGRMAVTFRAGLFPLFEGFGKLFEKAVLFMENNADRITAVFQKTAGRLIHVLTAIYNLLKKVFSGFASWYNALRNGSPIITALTAAVTTFSAVMAIGYAIQQKALIISKAAALWHGIQTTATALLTGAQWALNAAFLASPLGWVALAVGAVVAAVTVCWNKFEGFRKVLLGVWEVVKGFGRALLTAVLEPIKKILSGVGALGKAIAELFKGNFAEAWDAAKQGAKEIGGGMLTASPVGMVINTVDKVKRVNVGEAWERGQQKGADSWQKSQEKKAARNQTTEAVEIPEVPAFDIDDPYNTAAKDTKGKKKIINLNDVSTVQDFNGSAEYTAITKKLTPVNVSLAEKTTPPAKLPIYAEPPAPIPAPVVKLTETASKITTPAPEVINEITQNYENGKNDYLQEITKHVRKIAAAVSFPLALSVASPETEATAQPQTFKTEITQHYEAQARSGARGMQIDKICENIVINVQNTDQRGTDEIKDAVFYVLNEIAEGLG